MPICVRGQAHALRDVHRLEHVLAKLGEFVVEFLTGLVGVSSTAAPYFVIG